MVATMDSKSIEREDARTNPRQPTVGKSCARTREEDGTTIPNPARFAAKSASVVITAKGHLDRRSKVDTLGWTAEQEAIFKEIMETEMWGQGTGISQPCTRPEAIRRYKRRLGKDGVYRQGRP